MLNFKFQIKCNNFNLHFTNVIREDVFCLRDSACSPRIVRVTSSSPVIRFYSPA